MNHISFVIVASVGFGRSQSHITTGSLQSSGMAVLILNNPNNEEVREVLQLYVEASKLCTYRNFRLILIDFFFTLRYLPIYIILK